MKDFNYYAVLYNLKLENNRIVYFRRTGSSKLITEEKNKFKLKLHDGKFSKLNEDIFIIDDSIDCIYFEGYKKLLILNKLNTEFIFELYKYYQKFTEEFFTNVANLAHIDPELSQKVLGKPTLIKRITYLQRNKKFLREIKFFKDHAEYFEKYKVKFKDKPLVLEFQGEKVFIDDDLKLNTFLSVCNDNYVQGVISKQPYIADDKESLT